MKKRPVYSIFLGVLVFLIIFWSAAPLLWIFISSISERTELYSIPPHWIPENPTFEAYEKVLITGESFRGGGGIAATELLRKGIFSDI